MLKVVGAAFFSAAVVAVGLSARRPSRRTRARTSSRATSCRQNNVVEEEGLVMRKLFFASLLALLGTEIRAEDNLYQDRWFYCSHRVEKSADVGFYADLVAKPARSGLMTSP